MRHMQAVIPPQFVVDGCMVAAEATGLGRKLLMEPLNAPIDHFAFCPLDYAKVSRGLKGMLDQPHVVELRLGGRATMGLQEQNLANGALCWYWGNPLPALAAVSPQSVPLKSGGGYVAVRAELELAASWLQDHNVAYVVAQPYGVDVLWVPLATPGWGVGSGYYALCVTTETLTETIQRLAATK